MRKFHDSLSLQKIDSQAHYDFADLSRIRDTNWNISNWNIFKLLNWKFNSVRERLQSELALLESVALGLNVKCYRLLPSMELVTKGV